MDVFVNLVTLMQPPPAGAVSNTEVLWCSPSSASQRSAGVKVFSKVQIKVSATDPLRNAETPAAQPQTARGENSLTFPSAEPG